MFFRAVAAIVGLIASLLLMEGGAWFAITRAGFVAERPTRGETGFWWGGHPELGVWKRPGQVGELATGCSTATYRMNSVGARDVERPERADGPRTIVLGDSFLEGWGVPETDRVSNRLEAATGQPHLNFAMAHFSPWQSLLAYESIASRFDHDTVLLGLLPVNDFMDLDLETPYGVEYAYRFRPYLVPDADGWREIQYPEPALRRWLRQNSHLYHLVGSALRSPAAEGAARPASNYRAANPRQLSILEEVLVRAARATAGKRLVVVVIPVHLDFEQEAGANTPTPLAARLDGIAAREGFEVVDLLPPMAEHTSGWKNYFLPCDYHWSRYGNRVAAEILEQKLYR